MDDDVEATRIISPLNESHYLTEAQKLLDRRLGGSKPPKPFARWEGKYPAYNFGDGEKESYIILADEVGDVAYFVRYRRISHNGLKLGRQVLLIRNPDTNAADGFAQYVFFNVLLPKYTALIADKEQTAKGRRFWLNAIQTAWARGHHVYFLDRRSRQTKLYPILNLTELGLHSDALWGTTRAHDLTFAVISKKPLSL